MSQRIHICNSETDAEFIIKTEKISSKDPGMVFDKMHVPDIMIYDHSNNLVNPKLLNNKKICVVFND